MGSQSNLIGIETRPKCINNNASASLNRTLLELKHERSVHRIGLPSCLSIEPYWNWNISRARERRRSPKALNRTLLELKRITSYQIFNLIFSQSNLIGIETGEPAPGRHHHPASQSNLIGIETVEWIRNVRAAQALNRTLLELKRTPDDRVALASTSQSNLIGIETGSGCVIDGHSRCSQSNLIGIETPSSSPSGHSAAPSQSNLIGIETYWLHFRPWPL